MVGMGARSFLSAAQLLLFYTFFCWVLRYQRWTIIFIFLLLNSSELYVVIAKYRLCVFMALKRI